MVSHTLPISGSQNDRNSREEGIADHFWPRAVFFLFFPLYFFTFLFFTFSLFSFFLFFLFSLFPFLPPAVSFPSFPLHSLGSGILKVDLSFKGQSTTICAKKIVLLPLTCPLKNNRLLYAPKNCPSTTNLSFKEQSTTICAKKLSFYY